ncbi:ParA family partition ATPase [Marinivivus vitaminiproducens]|uniref:ParA family partition ATPase n=1 Tax=Marinivivus vitaminiproducens TaxID=3035935 RepID=UPI0027A83FAE|nr:ParA family partition ATPase [Geminicoccaceae bacterium SCSIO 64248]
MTGKVITVAQQKGGAGKTTVLAQLAVAWVAEGLRVAVIDIDPQGSLTGWLELREEAGEGVAAITGTAKTAWRLGSTLRGLARDHDIVLVDSPPHAATEAKVAIRAADLVLVPCQPSRLDLWAAGPTLDLAVEEGLPARVVLNRVPARGRIDLDIGKAVEARGAGLLEPALGNRVAFAQSMNDGLGVVETAPRGPAAQEIQAVAGALRAALA